MTSAVTPGPPWQLAPPEGWSFEPSEVTLTVDGETDMCSQGQDVDFSFLGFGVTGQVRWTGRLLAMKNLWRHRLRLTTYI